MEDQIPRLGFGTWQIPREVTKQAVLDALNSGYTHIDCAYAYENEVEVGQAFKEFFANHDRSKYFIVTKLWNTHHHPDHVEELIKIQLKNLQLDYLDLYLIHGPFNYKYGESMYPFNAQTKLVELEKGYGLRDTWKAMEALQEKGYTKRIGVSKYNEQLMMDLLSYCKIKPFCNQIEVSPVFQNKNLIKLCLKFGVQVVGYCPLASSIPGKGSMLAQWAKDPKMCEIAKNHNKTIAQIILHWHLQKYEKGYAIIVKSVHQERMKENREIFDFKLTNDEMAYIDSLSDRKNKLTNTGARTGVPIEYN